uniref:Uncharacterized protein n=1 Tax=Magallana gigas TaxID=29159 RepID=A0A8W8NP34_MAGGI
MQCISVEIHLYSPGHRSKQPRNPIARSTKWNAPAQQSLSAHATDDLSIQLLLAELTKPDGLPSSSKLHDSAYYASSEPKEQNSTPSSFAKNPQTLEGFRQEASKAELGARLAAKPEVSDTQAVTNYTMLTAIQDLTRNVQALQTSAYPAKTPLPSITPNLWVTIVMLHFGLFMDMDK